MVAKPLRISKFIELMIGEPEHGCDNLGLFGYNVIAVFSQEDDACQESGPFVPIDKAMVL